LLHGLMTPETCRAARGLLGLTQAELATAASVGLSTVKNYENGIYTPIPNNLAAIRRALEDKGALLIAAGEVSPVGGVGVRLKP